MLQGALEVCVARFPSIAARLRRGAFWYYLQQVEQAPTVGEEFSYPLTHMGKEEMRRCALRVIAHGERIAVEYFHALTDGTGAIVFIKNLVAEYLTQKYGLDIPLEDGIVDRQEEPRAEELEDSFQKYAGPVRLSRRDSNAWHMTGQPELDGFLHMTCFHMPVDQALALARSYGVSLTVFMSAAMLQALLELQKEKEPEVAWRKPVKLLIPVNLRQLFPSSTLRNFSMFTIPEVDSRLGEYTFEEICSIIVHKMGLEVNPKHMGRVIAANVGDERNTLVRLIPLPLKNLVMKAVFNSVGEKKSCLSLSNVGVFKVPQVMGDHIRRFDAILGVQATAPYNCGMYSYGDRVSVSFIRNICQPELERHFYQVLHRLGLPVMVESNRNER